MKVSARKRVFNLVTINQYKDAVKQVRQAVAAKKKDEAAKALGSAYKHLDKAVKKHVIHKNRAARLKSRLSQAIAKMA